MKFTIIWHIIDEFYNVRVPKGMSTISQSIMRMRSKIYNVEDVDWKYHVVLTLNDLTVKKYVGGIDSKILRTFLTKVKKIFPDEKHFWKYEEGRESERPHFHLLFDLRVEVKDKMKDIEKIIDVGDISQFVAVQKEYGLNRKKSDLEIIMGYFMFKLWNKGIAHARFIKNKVELAGQVERDVAKRTGTKGFKENKRKYGFSRGLTVKKVVKIPEYEWAGNVSTVDDAVYYLEVTKDNFIKHFEVLDYDGDMIYVYTVDGLKDYERQEKRKVDKDKEQVKLDVFEKN